MAFLTKDQILGAEDRKFETVNVPEWRGDVRIRSLSGKERSLLELAARNTDQKGRRVDLLERVAAVSICDEAGSRVFAEGEIAVLGERSAAALDRIAKAAFKLNALSEDEIKELEGN